MSGIVWLASYPKSGNTWIRILLANYLRDASAPIDINNLGDGFSVASSRQVFDRWAGVESSALDHDTVDSLRPALYRQIAGADDEVPFVKAHDAWHLTPNGEPMFPAQATAVVIYVLRNPLDVAPSLAAHLGGTAARAVTRMCDPEASFSGGTDQMYEQLRQFTGTWSDHVCGWIDESGLPCHIVRYEDLSRDPQAGIRDLVKACGLPWDGDRAARAVRFSDISELRRQEAEHGFAERHPRSREAFFGVRGNGSSRRPLDDELAQRLRIAHSPTMRRFGYL